MQNFEVHEMLNNISVSKEHLAMVNGTEMKDDMYFSINF